MQLRQWDVELQFLTFLILALDGGERSGSGTGSFTLGAHWTEGCRCTRAGIYSVTKRKIPVPYEIVTIQGSISEKRNTNNNNNKTNSVVRVR
jgi:hypothetical protein